MHVRQRRGALGVWQEQARAGQYKAMLDILGKHVPEPFTPARVGFVPEILPWYSTANMTHDGPNRSPTPHSLRGPSFLSLVVLRGGVPLVFLPRSFTTAMESPVPSRPRRFLAKWFACQAASFWLHQAGPWAIPAVRPWPCWCILSIPYPNSNIVPGFTVDIALLEDPLDLRVTWRPRSPGALILGSLLALAVTRRSSALTRVFW